MGISTKGRHFPRDLILMTVRWYLCYGLSYRDLAEMLEERGFLVDHTTIYGSVAKFCVDEKNGEVWRYFGYPAKITSWKNSTRFLLNIEKVAK